MKKLSLEEILEGIEDSISNKKGETPRKIGTSRFFADIIPYLLLLCNLLFSDML